MFDSLHLTYFLLGLVGALLTLYLAKQVIIPEFRPLIDVTPVEESARQSRADIAKIKADIDKTRMMMTEQPLNSYYLTRVYSALDRSLRAEQNRLDRSERRLALNQLVSRSLGFFFFVLLGGVFAALFSDQVKISLQGPSGASLPGFFQAVVIGAGWTGLVSIFGIRGLQSRATEMIGQMGEESKKRIDELKTSLVQAIRPEHTAEAVQAAAPTAEQLSSAVAARCEQAKKELSAHLDKARDSIKRIV
jgi:hypothetical protein